MMLRFFRWGAALSVLTLGCATADIRPESMTTGSPEALTVADGQTWLKRAATAQGGLDAMRSAGTLSMVLVDDWPGWLTRTVGSPWPNNPQRIQLEAQMGTDDGRLTLLDGADAGQVWGVQHWATYRTDEKGQVVFDPVDEPDDTIKFWVPTVLYFPLLAFRILEADVVRYAGDEIVDGKAYAVVYATWGDEKPQDDVDQYILWIDRETSLIRWARYTVRDFAGWMVGMMRYDDYRSVGPIKLPFSMVNVSDFDDEGPSKHAMKVESAEVGKPFPPEHLYPRPQLRAKK